MPTVQMTLELPEDLVRDAKELNILNEEVIIELLRKEIDERVMALVNEEVHAHRAEKKRPEDSQSTS